MGSIKSIDMTIDEICSDIENEFEKSLTEQILNFFAANGYTYLVSATNPQRIYCYIRKSKESLIINKKTYADRQEDCGYSLQIRVTSQKSYTELDKLSENVRANIIGGRDCKAPNCCNCGNHYSFSYNETPYRKCHMLCDNYLFSNLTEADISSVFMLIENEIKPKQK